MKTFRTTAQKGFTIIETLVAVSILMLAITGPLAIVAQSLKSAYYSRDQVTAFYLGQEVIEYVRNKRDENALRYPGEPENWLANVMGEDCTINDSNSTVNKCSLVLNTGVYSFVKCDSTGCSPLNFDPATGIHGIGSPTGTLSQFSRTVYFNKVRRNEVETASNEILVTVEVEWKSGSTPNKFVIREYLTNWKAEQAQ